MRTCKVCGVELPPKDLRRRYCDKHQPKSHNEYMREWLQRTDKKDNVYARMKKYIRQPEKQAQYNQRNRERQERIKSEVMRAYGGKCACCGESRIEFLTIDHANGDGAQHREILGMPRKRGTGRPMYRRLQLLGYPQDIGIQVLCFNCHMAKDKYGSCPHQRDAHI